MTRRPPRSPPSPYPTLSRSRPEDPHSYIACLVRAPLVLARQNDTTREVRDPSRRVGLVDVLAAGPRGPVGVDLQILLIDVYLYPVVYDRGDGYRGKAGVPPTAGVVRADPDQPVDAALSR